MSNNMLCILSYNVSGLCETNTLRKIKECIPFPQNGEDTLNIYIFQETKSSPKIKRFWTTLFVIYAHAGNSSG